MHADSCTDILNQTQSIDRLPKPAQLDAVYLPGGHGACADFPDNQKLQQFLATMFEQGKIVSSVCHGPVAFANVKLSSGEALVKDKKVHKPSQCLCVYTMMHYRAETIQALHACSGTIYVHVLSSYICSELVTI